MVSQQDLQALQVAIIALNSFEQTLDVRLDHCQLE